MSKVIKAEDKAKKVTAWEFIDLEYDELPEPTHLEDVFRMAEFFRPDNIPRKDKFSPSWTPGERPPRPPTKAEVAEAEVQEELDLRRQEAIEAGRQEGLAAAQAEIDAQKAELEQARAEAEQAQAEAEQAKAEAVHNLLSASEQILGTRQGIVDELEKDLTKVIMLAASKVVAAEIKANRRVILRVVKAAMEYVTTSRWVRIRVNPADHKLVEKFKSRLKAANPDLTKIEVHPDPEVGRGGCLVSTESEEIDDTIETRLDNLSKTMEKILRGLRRGN